MSRRLLPDGVEAGEENGSATAEAGAGDARDARATGDRRTIMNLSSSDSLDSPSESLSSEEDTSRTLFSSADEPPERLTTRVFSSSASRVVVSSTGRQKSSPTTSPTETRAYAPRFPLDSRPCLMN